MLRAADKILSRLEEGLIGMLLATASLVLFANVVGRYGFNAGVTWAEELVRYEIVWMVFIGGSVAVRRGIHIGVDVLQRLLEGRARRYLIIGVNLLCLGFSAFLLLFGVQLVSQTQVFGQVTPALQVPLWTVQLAIPVGGGLMALRFGQQIYEELRGGARAKATDILGG